MIRKIISLFVLLVCLPVFSCAETLVTSFYPVWLLALNLTRGVDAVTVRNMAAPDYGCLHDYQLQPADRKALAEADAFLINGAGMESFLPMVTELYPDLPVLSAAEGISLLDSGSAMMIGDAEDGVNAHIWLDPRRMASMADNLSAGLSAMMPAYADTFSVNCDDLKTRLAALDQTLRSGLSDLSRRDMITFHEAFPYFADAYGLNVVAVVAKEPGEVVTPAQMAELTQIVRTLGNPPLFVEPQYEELSARTLAAETGTSVYTLDPVVTGPESDVPFDYYETVMLQNLQTLQEALR